LRIQYILDKNNSKVDIFNKKNNYIKTKTLFNCNILFVNNNKLLLANKYKLNATLQILRNNTKEFLIKKEKL